VVISKFSKNPEKDLKDFQASTCLRMKEPAEETCMISDGKI
jgi:hypothetical protein